MARRRPVESEIEIEVFENGRPRRQPLDVLLRRLITLAGSETPILSLYLDLRWADEQQRDRVALTVKDRVRQLARPELDDDLAAIVEFTEARVKQQADVGFGGAALFRGGGLDLALRTPARLPTLLAAGPAPLVRPLVQAAHGHERAIVALPSSDEVRVYELAMGRLTDAGSLRGDAPSHHDRGGWSQLKLQHYRQERIDALHRAAAEAIAHLFDAGGPVRVLIGGANGAAANLERELPKRVQEHALRLEHLQKDDPAHRVLAEAQRALVDADHLEEREALSRVRTLALSKGPGALGVEQVVAALNQARPMRLFVPDRAEGAIEICESCRFLSVASDGACPSCGGRQQSVEVCEGLVRAALGLGARIDVVDRALLDALGGAAAELRY